MRFSSTYRGNELTHDDEWQKLELVVHTARKVWGERAESRAVQLFNDMKSLNNPYSMTPFVTNAETDWSY